MTTTFAQVKTLCIQPELLAEEGSKLSIVYTPIHGSGNVPVRRILREVGISNVSVVKEQELPDPNFSTVKVPNPEDPAAFTLAMKLAECELTHQVTGEYPVVLLDDVMSELDGRRRDALVTAMEGGSQTFITTANIDYFNEAMLNKSNVIHLPLV